MRTLQACGMHKLQRHKQHVSSNAATGRRLSSFTHCTNLIPDCAGTILVSACAGTSLVSACAGTQLTDVPLKTGYRQARLENNEQLPPKEQVHE